ncbi:expressed unknown protein [Seminavis robusta]|uniref:Sulfotransferase n=1 Tax=Seminavis robusta TaxID=568900 RepID=A0A9N8HGP2_9STRA|nr:expressed unknown protein [Seminavis robusta]|eukprot:Sro495_g154410.1 n/a (345) ;mRNA; f:14992-16135
MYVLVLMILILGIYISLQVSMLSKLGLPATPQYTARTTQSQQRRHRQWVRLIQMRRQPGYEKNTNGAFIHMGKTGGSTLSLRLRNGCHSYMTKPCRSVPLETVASRLVGTYYHVPDFGLIPQSKHPFYIMTLRDPFQRSVSAFVYEHLDNVKARGETISPLSEEAKTEAKKCFPTLETFVEYIGDNPDDYDYPYHRSQIVATNCTSLARAVMDAKVRRFNHFFFPFQKIRDFIPTDNNPIIFATRQEHLWYDWKKINFLLGQVGDVVTPPDKARDLSDVNQPVTRDLSELGRHRLCKALQKEYDGYVRILREAINLNDKDVEESLAEIHQNCPNVIIWDEPDGA